MKKRGVLSQLKREKVSYLMLLPNVIMFLIFTGVSYFMGNALHVL